MSAGLMDAHMMIMPWIAQRAATGGYSQFTNIETVHKEVTAAESKDHRPERQIILYLGADEMKKRFVVLSQEEVVRPDWFMTMTDRLRAHIDEYEAFIVEFRRRHKAANNKSSGGKKPAQTRGSR
jgi:hypothetical protein